MAPSNNKAQFKSNHVQPAKKILSSLLHSTTHHQAEEEEEKEKHSVPETTELLQCVRMQRFMSVV